MSAQPDTCIGCRFLQPASGRQTSNNVVIVGECRRRAPEFKGLSAYARWPEVTEFAWCGEWAPKDALTPQEQLVDSLQTIADAAKNLAVHGLTTYAGGNR